MSQPEDLDLPIKDQKQRLQKLTDHLQSTKNTYSIWVGLNSLLWLIIVFQHFFEPILHYLR